MSNHRQADHPLFISPPFIVIESSDRPVILNLGTAAETKALYDSLVKK